MKTCAVILNPISGTARGRLDGGALSASLSAAGYEAELLPTRGAGHAAELAGSAAERHPVVVVAGGDGTVSEAASVLAGAGAVLAVLPTGSGNDFAAGLGIVSPAAGLAALRDGAVRALDVARFAGRAFVNSCGLFFNGEVSLRAAGVPRRWGRFRYPLATLPLLGRLRGPRARWSFAAGGEGPSELDEVWTLAEVGNGVQCGGGFRLTPRADPADGLLDFCLVRAMDTISLLRTLPKGVRGEHLSHPDVLYPRAGGAVMECEEGFAVHWDGEADRLPAGSHAFSLEAGVLQTIVPKGGTT